MKILVASDDERKINEIKNILKEYEIISLKESGIELNAEEIGQTFEQNSKIRAMGLAKYTKEIVLAYSEGLWIDCLDGFPGIKTYRILGKDATDEERNAYLLRQLEGKDIYQRIAEVVTAVTVIRDGEIYRVSTKVTLLYPVSISGVMLLTNESLNMINSLLLSEFGLLIVSNGVAPDKYTSYLSKLLILFKSYTVLSF